MKSKHKNDRIVSQIGSPLKNEMFSADEREWAEQVAVSGDLDIGRRGNPVTVIIEDEVSGQTLEINHVDSAFLVVEDKRSGSSGWLAMVLGDLKKVGKVLDFLAGVSLENLKKMMSKD